MFEKKSTLTSDERRQLFAKIESSIHEAIKEFNDHTDNRASASEVAQLLRSLGLEVKENDYI